MPFYDERKYEIVNLLEVFQLAQVVFIVRELNPGRKQYCKKITEADRLRREGQFLIARWTDPGISAVFILSR